ncbi:hypothetical protein KIL84_015362 [Mauremys mutica]|uniref:Uncharacterized protein n=1 Tax=Mauremys mutica TaxID=74926 RepID=A0A9D3WSA2_9SAUR|nr:hypothetical protein KIL84_015362 [Mauremys mutica]
MGPSFTQNPSLTTTHCQTEFPSCYFLLHQSILFPETELQLGNTNGCKAFHNPTQILHAQNAVWISSGSAQATERGRTGFPVLQLPRKLRKSCFDFFIACCSSEKYLCPNGIARF